MSKYKNRSNFDNDDGGGSSWMDTYGDLVTLLLTFYVLLFSFSEIDAQKWAELASAFAGNPIRVQTVLDAGTGREISVSGLEAPMRQREVEKKAEGDELEDVEEEGETGMDGKEEGEDEFEGNSPFEIQDDLAKLYYEMKGYIKEQDLDTVLSITKDGERILLRVRDSALFDSGKSDIKEESIDLLDHIIDAFDRYSSAIMMIRIEGHTDNVPISSSRFEDNWDLSTSRATNVLRYFLEGSGLDPKQYSAVGYGEFQPVADNGNDEGKAMNRRVDFVILGNEIHE